MEKILDPKTGDLKSVVMTREEWRQTHRDFKVAKPERRVMVSCPNRGTVLVQVDIGACEAPRVACDARR